MSQERLGGDTDDFVVPETGAEVTWNYGEILRFGDEQGLTRRQRSGLSYGAENRQMWQPSSTLHCLACACMLYYCNMVR